MNRLSSAPAESLTIPSSSHPTQLPPCILPHSHSARFPRSRAAAVPSGEPDYGDDSSDIGESPGDEVSHMLPLQVPAADASPLQPAPFLSLSHRPEMLPSCHYDCLGF